MAGKQLFSADLAAAVDTDVATVTALKEWSFSISFCNRTTSAIRVRLAIAASALPIAAEYYLYDVTVPANNTLERSGHVAQAGKHIVCRADAAGISVNGHGYEE